MGVVLGEMVSPSIFTGRTTLRRGSPVNQYLKSLQRCGGAAKASRTTGMQMVSDSISQGATSQNDPFSLTP